MGKDITGTLIIHNDSSLLRQTLESVKFLLDRLVVVDGAYEWVAPFCEMDGENPEKSTDNLIKILDESGIDYDYYSGIWKDETEKRIFSLEKSKNNKILKFDSDEILDIDEQLVQEFFKSNKAIAGCFCPLYFSPSFIGLNVSSETPPITTNFFNKLYATNREIVDSMLLMVPEAERTARLGSDKRFKDTLGTVHHLSLFRTQNSGFRRARFYNLLAARLAGSLNLIDGQTFTSDNDLYRIIVNLPHHIKEALNNYFKYHRISMAIPVIKSNQKLIESKYENEEIKSAIFKSFSNCNEDLHRNFIESQSKKNIILTNKNIFIDITIPLNKCSCTFNFFASESDGLVVSLIRSNGATRSAVDLRIQDLGGHTYKFSVQNDGVLSDRSILDIKIKSKVKTSEFWYELIV